MSHGLVTGMGRGGAVSPLVVASDEGVSQAVEAFGPRTNLQIATNTKGKLHFHGAA